MFTLTLEDIFGVGALQTSTHLIIQKSSLMGLTPQINNRAEQLLAAIVTTALKNFEGQITANGEILTVDEIPLTYTNTEFFEDLEAFLWKVSIVDNSLKTQIVIHWYET